MTQLRTIALVLLTAFWVGKTNAEPSMVMTKLDASVYNWPLSSLGVDSELTLTSIPISAGTERWCGFGSLRFPGNTNIATAAGTYDLETRTIGPQLEVQAARYADGLEIGLISALEDVVAPDTNGRYDVFLCDGRSRTITRLTELPSGEQSNGDSAAVAIDPLGQFAFIATNATNVLPERDPYEVLKVDFATREWTRTGIMGRSGSSRASGLLFSPNLDHYFSIDRCTYTVRSTNTTTSPCDLVGLRTDTGSNWQYQTSHALNRMAFLGGAWGTCSKACVIFKIVDPETHSVIATIEVASSGESTEYGNEARFSGNGRYFAYPKTIIDVDRVWYTLAVIDTTTLETKTLNLGTPFGAPDYQKGLARAPLVDFVSNDGRHVVFYEKDYGASMMFDDPMVNPYSSTLLIVSLDSIFTSRFE